MFYSKQRSLDVVVLVVSVTRFGYFERTWEENNLTKLAKWSTFWGSFKYYFLSTTAVVRLSTLWPTLGYN